MYKEETKRNETYESPLDTVGLDHDERLLHYRSMLLRVARFLMEEATRV